MLREGDRKASDASDLLFLKTTVVKYTPGSETRRAVTTFERGDKINASGVNSLHARAKLCSITR